MGNICSLCHSGETSLYYEGESREYFLCSACHVVFVPETFFHSDLIEKEMYDKHQNSIDDVVYQKYLKRLMDPVVDRIPPGAKGLDFGCGPGPALSLLFEKRGFEMDIYDVFYAPNSEVFQNKYDFITASEVVEHFHDPKMELDRLFNLLNVGGVLAIKTQMLPSVDDFPQWYYKRDTTHVCLFSQKSFEFLAVRWGAKLEFVDTDIIIFTKLLR